MSKSQHNTNSFILFEDAVRVVIATGFTTKSKNVKTGNMIQIWILVKAENPIEASKSGNDSLVCGTCPLRGTLGKGWRTFRVAAHGNVLPYSNEIMCVNTTRGITCEKCGLCNGAGGCKEHRN